MRRVRRVVTGHDGDGRATVSIDDMPQRTPSRPGVTYWVAWTSEGFPVDNTVDGDQARRAIATILSNGTVFRIVQFAPGGRQAPQDRGRTARSRRRRALNFRAAQHPQALVLVGDVDIAPRVDEHVLRL